MFQKLSKIEKPLKNYSNLQTLHNNLQKDPLGPNHPSRILITGSSSKGKTTLCLNLIFDYLPWTRLYIFAKDLSEPCYTFLNEILCKVQEKDKNHKEFFWFNSTSDSIVDIDSLDKKEINLIIFDDFIMDKDSMPEITNLFIRGRKKNASIVFLTQSYYNVPKPIRLQCNYLIFFKLPDEREISNIYNNHSMGLTKSTFVKVFKESTNEPYSFLLFDLQTNDDNKKIRKNFNYGFTVNI